MGWNIHEADSLSPPLLLLCDENIKSFGLRHSASQLRLQAETLVSTSRSLQAPAGKDMHLTSTFLLAALQTYSTWTY
jgi:hypothetical protein